MKKSLPVYIFLMLEGPFLLKQRETGGLQKLIAHKRNEEIKLKEMVLPGTGEALCLGVVLIKRISLLARVSHIFALGAPLAMSTVDSQGSFCK